MKRLIALIVGTALGVVPVLVLANDATSPVGTVNAFRQALEGGDRRTVLELPLSQSPAAPMARAA